MEAEPLRSGLGGSGRRRPPLCRPGKHAEDGQGLVELIIALTILAIAIGGLLTVLTAGAVSLQRSDKKGTALTIAEAQIELYRNLTYSDIRLDHLSLPVTPAADPYNTAYITDATIPNPTGDITDSTAGTESCRPGGAAPTAECKPVQNVVGPDHGNYRVDTYITAHTPTGGSPIRQVTVVVRDLAVKGLPILARNTSTFSPIDAAAAKSLPRLTANAPTNAFLDDPISGSSIVAGLTGAQNPTGTITFFVNGPRATAPSSCLGSGWSQIGTATVTGNTNYPSNGDYTPTSIGNYWWYASYSGDVGNNPTSSPCGFGMAETVVADSKATPLLSVDGPPSGTGVTNTAIPVNASISGGAGPTGQIVVKVFGPSTTAPATCASGGTVVGAPITPTGNGVYTVSFTTSVMGTYWWYATFAGDANNHAVTSSCSPPTKTVVTPPPDTFGISTIANQTANVAFTITSITANLPGGGVDTNYKNTHCITFSDPSNSPLGNAPVYPARGSCAVGESAVSFSAGVATNVSIKLFDAQTTTLTATDNHGANGTVIIGHSNSFTVNAGSTSSFALTNPGAQTAGVQFSVGVTTTDAWGNHSSDAGTYTVSWSGAGNSPNNTAPVYGSTSLVFAAGNALATGFKFFNAANTTLKMTRSGTTYTTSFDVNGGTGTNLTMVNPGNQTAGTSFGVTFKSFDSWGNVSNDGSTHTVIWSGASNAPDGTPPVYGSSSFTLSGGQATVSGFKLYRAASTTLKATEGATNYTATFTVNGGSVAKLNWTGTPTVSTGTLSPAGASCVTTCSWSSAGRGNTFKASVTAWDAYSNPITGLTITFDSDNGSWGNPTAATGATGATTVQTYSTANGNNWSTATVTASAGSVTITINVAK